ncbi:MAG: murein biosynthesis integral membrane protein MurJ [Alphaproteobacteria bacterium]|nr:murein biosynthesis integral membrane protein MurJ [Alphaproteobacteria bacterium]
MSLIRSIATVSSFTMISRVTGFVRDMVIANFLGAGLAADAFFVALKFPNLFRRFFAEGAFNAAFVPIYSGELESDKSKKIGSEKAKKFSNEAFSILALILLVFVILFEIAMPWAIYMIAPGFADNSEKIALATELSQITFPFLLFISLVSLLSGVLNSVGKFAAAAATPVILNLCMILSLFLLTPFVGSHARALAFGVSIAGVLQLLWLMAQAKRSGVCPRFVKPKFSPNVKLLFKRVIPGIMGAGVYQINLLIDTILVSFIANGAVSWLYYANRLNQLPLGVVGAAVGTALLPLLSRQIKVAAENGGDETEIKKTQNRALVFSMLITVPATVGLIALASPIVSLLFERGAFGEKETQMTAVAMIALTAGLPAYVLAKVFAPNFFARGDTKTPVKIATAAMGMNVVLNLILMFPFGHVGIAAATSISAWFSVLVYWIALKRRGYLKFDKELIVSLIKIIFCSLIMWGALWGLGYWADMMIESKQCATCVELGLPSSNEGLIKTSYIAPLTTIVMIIMGVFVYGVSILLTKAIDFNDLFGSNKIGKKS